MSEQNLDQSILEQRGAQEVLHNDHSPVLGVDQKPLEVEVMDKVHQQSVQLVRVRGVEDPGVVHLAGDDAPRADLPSVPTLGGVPPDVQHHRVLLGDEPDALVKGHGRRFIFISLKEYMQVFKFFCWKKINLNSWKL